MLLMNRDQDDPDTVMSWPSIVGALAWAVLMLSAIGLPVVVLMVMCSQPKRWEDDLHFAPVKAAHVRGRLRS